MRELSAMILTCALFTGCASMCDSSFDCDFHAFGGIRDRIDRRHGRVGSVFDPASAQPAVVPPAPTLAVDKAEAEDGEEAVDGESGNQDTESDDVQELRKRLLDELDGMDDLPEINAPQGTGFESEV